ncbi:MAG: IPT/TIG domain-containing protein [Planctomycetaceae bacterium]
MRTRRILVAMLLAAGCGGGGGAAKLAFFLTGLTPAVSTGLNGGDQVTITGSNFLAAVILVVRFGDQPALNLQVVNDTTLRVNTPPAPGRIPQTVSVIVDSLNAGSKSLFSAFTYQGSSSPPNPQTIVPTSYVSTGAERFTIQGTDLGPPGGIVQVTFQGIGTVTANVSNDSTIVQGRAPLPPGAPPSGLLTVTVGNGALSGDVVTKVTFPHAPPQPLAVPNQRAGGASLPERLADGWAALCTAGANGIWRDGDDELLLVRGPPNAVAVLPVRRPGALPVGFLDRDNSAPAAMDGNTFCVASVGPNGAPGDADDRVLLVTAAQTAPVVTDIVVAGLNTAPLAPIASNRVALTHAGADTLLGTLDDTLVILEFTGTAVTGGGQTIFIGPVDTTPGAGNLSIPFTADGNAAFVVTLGGNGLPRDQDDVVTRLSLPSQQVRSAPVPALLRRPFALSGILLAGAGKGPDGVPGSADDDLIVVFESAGALSTLRRALGSRLQAGALAPDARVGGGAVALATAGPNGIPNDADDRLLVFLDPRAGAATPFDLAGIPLLATFGSGELAIFGRGPDLADGTADDVALRLDAAASFAQPFVTVPRWGRGFLPRTDLERLFAVGPGADGVAGTLDDELIVHQTRALGQARDATPLPLAAAGAPVNPPNLAPLPFVPIGPGWGLMQSPGAGGGPLPLCGDADDQLRVVRA